MTPRRRLGALLLGAALVTPLGPTAGASAPAPRTAHPTAVAAADTPAAQAATTGRRGRCRLRGPYDYPHGGEAVDLDPADFTTRIDHPYYPMRPGTVSRFREGTGKHAQRITVKVTHRTTRIRGIRARVVHDVVREDGAIIEDTLDWYAQDSGGNIWYLGEATEEYEDGHLVSTEGSWRYGRDGAQAGLLLAAAPRPGCAYREEYYAGEAEDRAVVLARGESLATPTGFHRRVLHTSNSTPLEPRVLEQKFYARGLGPVVEVDVSPRFSRAVLVSVTHRGR